MSFFRRVGFLSIWILVGLAPLPASALDRPDDIVAFVVRDNFGGRPGLYLSAKRNSATYEKVGTIDLFCSSDSPGWAIIRVKGRLVAINGTGKTWARNGMEAFLRDGSTQIVALADDVPEANFPDAYKAIGAALEPCRGQDAQGVEQTLNRLRDATERYPAQIGNYRRNR